VELEQLGPSLDPGSLVRLDLPEAEIGTRRIRATVLRVDRFGNVQLNLSTGDLERAGITPGTTVELEVGLERYYAVAARTFAEVRRGDIVLYEDASWTIALAINHGNAAEMFGAAPGQEIRVARADP
jgi:S-adenosylmethionine hydrolase